MTYYREKNLKFYMLYSGMEFGVEVVDVGKSKVVECTYHLFSV